MAIQNEKDGGEMEMSGEKMKLNFSLTTRNKHPDMFRLNKSWNWALYSD